MTILSITSFCSCPSPPASLSKIISWPCPPTGHGPATSRSPSSCPSRPPAHCSALCGPNSTNKYVGLLLELLRRQLLEQQRLGVDLRSRLVAGLALIDQDSVGVLLQLGQVLRQVGVVEVHPSVEVLLHSVRVAPVELGPCQFDQHFFDEGGYLVKHLLELLDFSLLLLDILLNFDFPLLILRGLVEDPLFLLVVPPQLLVLGPEVLVDIHQVVDLLVEHVHVGEEVVVLLLALDEGVLDLLDIGQSGGLLDGVEGLVDDLHVPLVVVDELHLLLVVHDEFGEPLFEHCGSVVLDGVDFPSLDPAASVQPWVLELFVEFSQATVVVGLVLLVLHLQTQHEVLTHAGGVLARLDVLSQIVDLELGFVDVALQTGQICLVEGLLLTQLVYRIF